MLEEAEVETLTNLPWVPVKSKGEQIGKWWFFFQAKRSEKQKDQCGSRHKVLLWFNSGWVQQYRPVQPLPEASTTVECTPQTVATGPQPFVAARFGDNLASPSPSSDWVQQYRTGQPLLEALTTAECVPQTVATGPQPLNSATFGDNIASPRLSLPSPRKTGYSNIYPSNPSPKHQQQMNAHPKWSLLAHSP